MKLRDEYKKINLKKYSIWTTWNANNPNHDPFEFCITKEADEIRANLGLTKTPFKCSLLLFNYTISPKNVKRPTITDAALNVNFCPPKIDFKSYGLTILWKNDKTVKYKLTSRPVGIHEPIEMFDIKLTREFN